MYVLKEAQVTETAVWSTPFLINMITVLKGSQFYFYSVSMSHVFRDVELYHTLCFLKRGSVFKTDRRLSITKLGVFKSN